MKPKKILKLAALNIGIVLFNIILFGVVGIQLNGADALRTAAGGAAIFLSISFFLYGNYTLLSQNDTQININEIDDYRDCIIALNQSYGKKAFDESITTIKEQVERFKKKKEKIFEILGQKFDVIDKVYEKFKTTIFDVEYVFLSNIKAILSKINAFDEEDYERLCRDISQKKFSDEVIASKKNIYKEYFIFVKNAIEDNEEIIVKLDALLLEISKHSTIEAGEIENMKEIKEMDELIKKSRYYI
ncbi:hypothetical protein CTHBC1_3052 [Acetivibrio thermocellus BC1]|nr:hypothetical protein CTHBC1_3052 [Acetivibrio thermocellus BC1]